MLEGNPGKRPLKDGPKPRRENVSCPSWLDADAREEWKRLAPELERMGLLTLLDRAAFSIYCVSFAHWLQCQETLSKEGTHYVAGNGRVKERPEVQMARRYGKLAMDIAAEFGMTPNSRARFNFPEPPTAEDLAFEALLD
jgi:P27 family predicted phage terminase small subunit